MSYLLDTNVISELWKKHPNTKVTDWVGSREASELFISVLTAGEIWQGISAARDPARQRRLREQWNSLLEGALSGNLIALGEREAQAWGILVGDQLAKGQPLPVIDSLVAATALVHDLTVVTRNVEDFVRCGASVLNPWE